MQGELKVPVITQEAPGKGPIYLADSLSGKDVLIHPRGDFVYRSFHPQGSRGGLKHLLSVFSVLSQWSRKKSLDRPDFQLPLFLTGIAHLIWSAQCKYLPSSVKGDYKDLYGSSHFKDLIH